ncbi:hypothetical protein [Rhodoligotrophos defluvii]|uniref:hypothetical protein n=1 Tax=Rhodoligotrophos defluvii TaxID=2561934 RepID=UPI0010C97927|nr:hypothetical protein [Rhodoligotrophos defluvii]
MKISIRQLMLLRQATVRLIAQCRTEPYFQPDFGISSSPPGRDLLCGLQRYGRRDNVMSLYA